MKRVVAFLLVSWVMAVSISPVIAQGAPVTLDWLAYQPVAQVDPGSDLVKTVEKKFNVKFNFVYVDEQKWNDVLNVKLAGGEVPDVIRLRTDLAKYVNQGVVGEVPVATIKQYAPHYYAAIEKYDPQGLSWAKSNDSGKNYGFSVINLDATYGTNLVWRLDWLKKVGINKVPETLKEFEEAVYAFVTKDPDGNGKNDTYGFSSTVLPSVVGAYGWFPLQDYRGANGPQVQWTKVNGKWVSAVTQPQNKEALSLLAKWYKDGIIDPEFITGENRGGYWAVSHAFINGKVGVTGNVMYYHWAPVLVAGGNAGTVLTEFQKVLPTAEYGKTVLLGKNPVGPTGKSGASQWSLATETFVISAKAAKDPKKVHAILSILDAGYADIEYQKLIGNGEKDVDYAQDAEGNLSQKGKTPAELRKKGVGVFNFMSTPPDFLKVFNRSSYAFADKAKTAGFQYPYLPATDAGAKYQSTLSRLTIETFTKIIIGSQSVDTWDTFVKQFNEQGGDAWSKELNSLK